MDEKTFGTDEPRKHDETGLKWRVQFLVDQAYRTQLTFHKAFNPAISFVRNSSQDMMALSYTNKQFEHMETVLSLLQQRRHRDAVLVSRSMLEGFVQLRWAFEDAPTRTDIWFWYGLIEDWRQLRDNERLGIPVAASERDLCDQLINERGAAYYSDKSLKELRKAEQQDRLPNLPEDPYRFEWHESGTGITQMMKSLKLYDRYGKLYKSSSNWIHWNTQAVLRAIDGLGEDRIIGFTDTDWFAASDAVLSACAGLNGCLGVLSKHFQLGLERDVEEVDGQLGRFFTNRQELEE